LVWTSALLPVLAEVFLWLAPSEASARSRAALIRQAIDDYLAKRRSKKESDAFHMRGSSACLLVPFPDSCTAANGARRSSYPALVKDYLGISATA
jgi:hypothetical protein